VIPEEHWKICKTETSTPVQREYDKAADRRNPPRIVLSNEQIRSFHAKGFLTLPAITTAEEVVRLRVVFGRLAETRAGFNEGAQFDLVSGDDSNGPLTLLEIMNPVDYAPELRNTLFHINARAIAKQLLGRAAAPFFEHAIMKPARHGGATPWHQDEAYRADGNFNYRQLAIWMPLQPVDLQNGCMQYLPGTHHGPLLAHRSPNDNSRVHALECSPYLNANSAIACPLPAGGCTIHDGRTLHYAGPNYSHSARWAYILNFDLPPKPHWEKQAFPWNEEKQTAHALRREAWYKQGGFVLDLYRRLRRGVPVHPHRLFYLMCRAWRSVLR